LPSGIIDQCFWRIKIEKDRERRGYSRAKGYKIYLSPYFQQIVKPKWEDTFPTHYPNFVFDEYQQMRDEAVAPLRRELYSRMGMDKTIETLREITTGKGYEY